MVLCVRELDMLLVKFYLNYIKEIRMTFCYKWGVHILVILCKYINLYTFILIRIIQFRII